MAYRTTSAIQGGNQCSHRIDPAYLIRDDLIGEPPEGGVEMCARLLVRTAIEGWDYSLHIGDVVTSRVLRQTPA